MNDASFLSQEDQDLGQEFLKNGYVIFDVEDRNSLNRIQDRVAHLSAAHLNQAAPQDATQYLNTIHNHVTPQSLNALRLHVINGLKAEMWVRQSYFTLAQHHIEKLVGNELVMQRNVNLSIQLPQDDSSLLPIHTDVWAGNSPFEIVAWLPLVDCTRTKSMYIIPPEDGQALHNRFSDFSNKSAEDLYQAVRDRAQFLTIDFGQIMIFSLALMHGNRVNEEADTRWSMNVRFKGALTPYGDKKLGEYFDPITVRPVTTFGMRHQPHQGFEDE